MTENKKVIIIGEMLHASITRPGEAMRHLLEMTGGAYAQPSEPLKFLERLIADQARQGADFIDVNLDALGADTPALMREYVRLVRENSDGVPVSVDSSNLDVLRTGLDEWFQVEDAPAPLVNSIPYNEIDRYQPLFDLRREKEFRAVCLLIGPEGPLSDVESIVNTARDMHGKAKAAGFRNDDLFFDTVTLGIASDSCVNGMGEIKPSHTYNSFHAIRKIRNDPDMRGVHAILGVSNWVYGATRRRIGHLRAFIEVGQRYGLDAVIADVDKEFGKKPAPPELVEFVEMFASLGGSEDSMMLYSQAMRKARAEEMI